MTHYICMDGWAGFHKEPVEIVGETPKKYRVKLLKDCRLPGRWREGKAGQIILVPKYVVTDKPPKER
jgi:hypothetical protein